MGERKRYTAEEKVKILREIQEDGKTVSQIAEGFFDKKTLSIIFQDNKDLEKCTVFSDGEILDLSFENGIKIVFEKKGRVKE